MPSRLLVKRLLIGALALFGIATAASAHDPSGLRISKTLDDSKSRQGDPMVITWGIVPDGTTMPKNNTPKGSSRKSKLVSSLDKAYRTKAGMTDTDYSKRPWFKIFAEAFNEFESKTGLTYVYVPYDDGSELKYVSSEGKKKRRADLRIGGLALEGSNDLRGYSGFPGPSGFTPNIVLNTAHAKFSSARSLDFLLGHENMHNLGIYHVIVDSNPLLTAVSKIGIGNGEGPQFDDLLGLHLRYGDAYEKGKGNNSAKNATELGELLAGQEIGLGFDAGTLHVRSGQTDFVSIDGKSDIDYYHFTVSEKVSATITLTPLGPEYEYVLEDKGRESIEIDAAKLNDLSFSLAKEKGRKIKIDETTLGKPETVTHQLAAGSYFIAVRGKQNQPQFYSIAVAAAPQSGQQKGKRPAAKTDERADEETE